MERKTYFNRNNPGEEVTVVNEGNSLITLSNGVEVTKGAFTSNYAESAIVSADDFFGKSHAYQIANDLKKMDTSRVPEAAAGAQLKANISPLGTFERTGQIQTTNNNHTPQSPIVRPVENVVIPNNTNTDVSAYKQYDENDDQALNQFLKGGTAATAPSTPTTPQPSQQSGPTLFPTPHGEMIQEEFDQWSITGVIPRRLRPQGINNPVVHNNSVNVPSNPIDPGKSFFDTLKRRHTMKVRVELDSQICSPDFIRMMADNFESDIVRYFADEISGKILKDPKTLSDIVYDQIRKEVYGSKKKTTKKKPVRKAPVKKDLDVQ